MTLSALVTVAGARLRKPRDDISIVSAASGSGASIQCPDSGHKTWQTLALAAAAGDWEDKQNLRSSSSSSLLTSRLGSFNLFQSEEPYGS